MNLQALRHYPLKIACLPFHHLGANVSIIRRFLGSRATGECAKPNWYPRNTPSPAPDGGGRWRVSRVSSIGFCAFPATGCIRQKGRISTADLSHAKARKTRRKELVMAFSCLRLRKFLRRRNSDLFAFFAFFAASREKCIHPKRRMHLGKRDAPVFLHGYAAVCSSIFIVTSSGKSQCASAPARGSGMMRQFLRLTSWSTKSYWANGSRP